MSSYYISCGCGVLRFPAVYSYQQKEGKFVSELLPRSTAEGTGGGGDQKTKYLMAVAGMAVVVAFILEALKKSG